ncbi:MAG: MotA/TolQ/ExbB proton channel family protein [Vampirovibrionales bacterium]|nr:MotA/TolQ/ExbB proton channel family protein [Vampirovibrionales bacterium]
MTIFGNISGFGLIGGTLVLGVAIAMANVPLHALFRPEALLIVIGGTLMAVCASFPAKTLQGTVRALFQKKDEPAADDRDLQAHIEELSAMAGFTRREGLMALAPYVEQISSPFLRKGLTLLVNDHSEATICDTLQAELERNTREKAEEARVLEVAGGFAPTMGIIGALIGLMSAVNLFEDPAKLGEGVAGAFSATLYGVALANMILLPLANKLRERARRVHFQQTFLLQGVLSISAGEHPVLLNEKLNAMLTPAPANVLQHTN